MQKWKKGRLYGKTLWDCGFTSKLLRKRRFLNCFLVWRLEFGQLVIHGVHSCFFPEPAFGPFFLLSFGSTLTTLLLYWSLFLALPTINFLTLSCFSTFGAWFLTLPLRAMEPWILPKNQKLLSTRSRAYLPIFFW